MYFVRFGFKCFVKLFGGNDLNDYYCSIVKLLGLWFVMCLYCEVLCWVILFYLNLDVIWIKV